MIDPADNNPALEQARETQRQRLRRPYLAAAVFGALVAFCVAIAALIGRWLPWPFSFALPLIVQVVCYVVLCGWLSRLTPLFPDHTAYNPAMPMNMVIAGMDRIRRGMVIVDRGGAAICIVLGVTMLTVAGLPPTSTFLSALYAVQPMTWAAASVFLAMAVALLTHSSGLVYLDTAQMYVFHAGARASARLLGLQAQPFRVGPERKRPYQLDLELLPPATPQLRLSIRQMLGIRQRHMPAIGAIIPVKYLPENPRMVVVLLEDQPDEVV